MTGALKQRIQQNQITTIMKNISRTLALLGLTTALFTGVQQVSAQDQQGQGQGRGGQGGPGGRGNFDPEQMRQRMNERMREQFAVTDDAEWKIISERIQTVTEARRATSNAGGMAAMFGRGGRGPGGPGGDQAGGGQGGRRGGFGGEPNPAADALQKAIDDKASTEVIKARLAAYRESQKAADEKLAKAQAGLKEVLDTRQEAVAVLMGLLP